jgi:hypothetical protein
MHLIKLFQPWLKPFRKPKWVLGNSFG